MRPIKCQWYREMCYFMYLFFFLFFFVSKVSLILSWTEDKALNPGTFFFLSFFSPTSGLTRSFSIEEHLTALPARLDFSDSAFIQRFRGHVVVCTTTYLYSTFLVQKNTHGVSIQHREQHSNILLNEFVVSSIAIVSFCLVLMLWGTLETHQIKSSLWASLSFLVVAILWNNSHFHCQGYFLCASVI